MTCHNWTLEQIQKLYEQPFNELIWQAQNVHRAHFDPNTIQVSTLLNIKVGGCPENCQWCGQSIYNKTGVNNEPLADREKVIQLAKRAKDRGATRFCMAASWRSPTQRQLHEVGEMVKGIKALGLETCITIGKLNSSQAQQLKEAGLDYYNHNLESSPDYFEKVASSQLYQDRLNTLHYVREQDIRVCSGGILGMGETHQDRLALLIILANQPEHPQSVPINRFVPIAGTPLEKAPQLDDFDFVRYVALARIMMPQSYIRLTGGRAQMSAQCQALCFLGGANSIHYGGPNMLVTPNVKESEDQMMFQKLGLQVEGAKELTHE